MPESTSALDKKLRTLQRRMDMIEAIAVFLSKHPMIASKCSLKDLYGKVGLDFDEKSIIAPMGKDAIVLRLSRYAREVEPGADALLCDDVSNLSISQLKQLFLEANFDIDG